MKKQLTFSNVVGLALIGLIALATLPLIDRAIAIETDWRAARLAAHLEPDQQAFQIANAADIRYPQTTIMQSIGMGVE